MLLCASIQEEKVPGFFEEKSIKFNINNINNNNFVMNKDLEFPLDCIGEIISFLKEPNDFLQYLTLSKLHYEYLTKENPGAGINIEFKLNGTNSLYHVNHKFFEEIQDVHGDNNNNYSFFDGDDEKEIKMKEYKYVHSLSTTLSIKRISEVFPNLRNLSLNDNRVQYKYYWVGGEFKFQDFEELRNLKFLQTLTLIQVKFDEKWGDMIFSKNFLGAKIKKLILSRVRIWNSCLKELECEGIRLSSCDGWGRYYQSVGSKKDLILNNDALKYLPKTLKKLNLARSNTFSSDGLKHFENLEELYLRDCKKMNHKAFCDKIKLKKLNVIGVNEHPSLGSIVNGIGLKKLCNLEVLLFDKLTDYQYLRGKPKLRVLKARESNITGNDIQYLKDSANSIEKITLFSASKFSDEGIKIMCDSNFRLKFLSLNSTKNITNKSLEYAGKLKYLKSIVLDENPNITDNGLQSLGKNKKIEYLSIEYTKKINGSGLKFFPSLKRLKLGGSKIFVKDLVISSNRLSFVSLRACNIGNDDLVLFSKKIKNKLNSINLRSILITTDSFSVLSDIIEKDGTVLLNTSISGLYESFKNDIRQ